MTLGLFSFVINAGAAAADRLAQRPARYPASRSAASRRTFSFEALGWASDRVASSSASINAIVGNCRPRTDGDGPTAGDRRGPAGRGTPVRDAGLRHGRCLDRGRSRAPWPAFPDPWIRQYSVKANDVAAVIAAVCAEAPAGSARTSSRAASGRPRRGRACPTGGSRSRGSARPTRTCGRRCERPRRRRSAALGRGRVGRRAGGRCAATRGRPRPRGRPRSTSCSASTRTSRPRPTPRWRSARAGASSA